jgi:hypothetical protein
MIMAVWCVVFVIRCVVSMSLSYPSRTRHTLSPRSNPRPVIPGSTEPKNLSARASFCVRLTLTGKRASSAERSVGRGGGVCFRYGVLFREFRGVVIRATLKDLHGFWGVWVY